MGYTADLEVRGRHVVCCGGHPRVLAPLTELVAAGARVTVIAADVATSVRDLAERSKITWLARDFSPADLDDAQLVLAGTGGAATDQTVRQAAADASRPVLNPSEPTPAAAGEGPGASAATGRVILIGGGPGAPGLLTVAGLDAIRRADVIVTDRLAPLAALAEAKPGAQVIDVAKIPRGHYTPQDRINSLLIEHARRGLTVARLKGGDNFVFGRGGEEWQACADAGIGVEVLPGVSSALAAPALAGIPVTHRDLTQGFTVVSGHLPPGHPGSTLDWAALARTHTTLVIMMGVATLPDITAALLAAGLDPTTPAATIAEAGLPGQQSVRGPVSEIAALTAAAGLRPPAVTVIGAVAGFDPHAH